MDELKREEVLLHYPHYGVISRCTDRGFGFVSSSSGQDEFIHIRDHSGRRLDTMERLEGKASAYVIGGHAFRSSQGKEGWQSTVVQWRLLDDIEPPLTAANYREERAKALIALNKEQLDHLLSAEWYIRLWRKTTSGSPKSTLRADSILDRLLHIRLKEAKSAEELIQLLAKICGSSWYGVTDKDRMEACRKFFQPSDWPPSVFIAKKPLESCPGFREVRPFCGEALVSHIRKAKTVAIDLESDAESIFEFGWKNAAGTGLRTSRTGLSVAELREASEECLLKQSAPCVVGHNLLDWDWPILQRHEVPFPESSSLWDTLIASWLLEPWRDSHALVVDENAHRADADSQACYDLFERQVARLAPCLEDSDYDIRSLIDRLFADPTLLARVDDRNYPNEIHESLSTSTVFPSCWAHEMAWQRGVHLELIAPENRLADPVLSPERCRHVATERNDISAKAVCIIVSDAADQPDTHGVDVRLSFLPPWLVNDDLRTVLRDAHTEHTVEEHTEKRATYYLAEDLFKLDESEINRRFTKGQLSIAHSGDVAAAWQKVRRQVLPETEVRKMFPGVTERRTGRALLPISDVAGSDRWLLFEPPGLNAAGASWSLLPSIPDWLQTDLEPSGKPIESTARALIPRWRDGDASRLDVDRLFVSADTTNRPLYLSDLMHSVLNLIRNCGEQEILLIGMRWAEEAEPFQHNLVQLELSSHHPGTPLRRLEQVCNRGLKVLACDRNDISQFTRAAIRLRKRLQIVLDEVPLHDWHALLNRPRPLVTTARDEEVSDFPDASSEDDENVGSEVSDLGEDSSRKTILRSDDIRAATSTFLSGWLHGLLGPAGFELAPCLILDARLADHRTARSLELPWRNVPFFSLEELLGDDALQVFFDICYPRREPIDIPNDYETYRSFLRENWDFEDFRPGTQRPAIETLIDNDRDILTRLPTGAGKSIIFHLPALLRSHYSGRLTIVITPLRALMRDQVDGLWRKQFTESVDYLSGGRDAWINQEVYQGILDGRLRLLFVAPERFRVPRFTEVLERRRRMDGGLEFVVFDEAHCVSEWGFEFRPDYLFAAQYVADWFKTKDLPGNPHRLLLTSATVTQRNRIDLEKELRLGDVEPYEDLPKDMPHPIQPYIVLESFDLHEDEEAPADEKFEKIIEVLEALSLDDSAALVFVRRRKDCHRISDALNAYAAQRDSGLASLHALPFHAGLPEAIKTEACDLLRDRRANVLVCTKAFGMGMDIPHIHACVHHRPPTFIEDFLQEVGRIGRDKEERERTGRDLVTATLLYNQDDIERNLSLLHDKAVKPPDLQDLFGYCLDRSTSFEGVEKALCIVPAKVRLSETKEFDENQVTNSLFWLERMGVLGIEGRHPPFLDLVLDLGKLSSYADGSSLPSRIANLLFSIVEESHSVVRQLESGTPGSTTRSKAENIFGRVIKGLLRGVLALVSPSEHVPSGSTAAVTSDLHNQVPTDGRIDVSISMSELMSGCGGISMDDLFAGLFELSKVDVLSVRKNFVISKNGVPSGNEFWDLLHVATTRLLQPTNGKVEVLPRKQFETELRDWYREFLTGDTDKSTPENQIAEPSKLRTRQIQREVYRAISTSIRVLRYSGVDLRESLSNSGVTQYIRAIPDSTRSSIVTSVNDRIQAMRNLLTYVSVQEEQSRQAQAATFEIPLTELMDALGDGIRVGRLKELMKLVETAGFYGFDSELDEWVTLVTLNTREPLASHSPESSENSLVQRVYSEMLEKFELQVLRAQAMVLLGAMPAENRKEYIDRYFLCEEANEIERLLEDTVGDVDDEVLNNNPMLRDLLSQVRRERFSEGMDALNENQLDVCKAPFDRTLLVNAGPGSGKTHVLMMRCAHLIHVQRIDPSAILVLAFNRAVVYEIRDRIRTLFRALGYGSYTNRLDVSTFHAFALRHQKSTDLYEEDAIEQAVHTFANLMESDKEFARAIGGRYKAVLIDEFQDMNEDFYSVVTALLAHCSGGGMVIGDDDQDILTWNRRDWQRKYGRDCPLDASKYFLKFRDSLEPDEHSLTLNYRSVPEIVQRANGMIETVSDRVGFPRMKSGAELSASRTDHGIIEMPFDPTECTNLALKAMDRAENLAVLCRSNRECRQIYEILNRTDGIPASRINLLGSADIPLYKLRHCGALLDICGTRNDGDFIERYIWEELLEEYEHEGYADLQSGRDYLEVLYSLVKEEVGRPHVRDVQAFIREMRASDVERLKAKTGLVYDAAKLTIATVHKVKGLEFDTVLVMPSIENFPFSRARGAPHVDGVDAAAEARLYYVAMTRARNRLYIGWGDRERSWFNCSRYEAPSQTHRYFLKGSPREVYVSWSGQEQQVRNDLQDYIKTQVRLGDPLHLRNVELRHDGQVVGRLSGPTLERLQNADSQAQLRVSNVIRYTSGHYFREHNPQFWDQLHESIKRQGWFYTVLAEEA